MIDRLVEIGLSNVCFSTALALLAVTVGAKFKRPQLTHLVWLLVLVKLVTPPILTFAVPLLPDSPEIGFTQPAGAAHVSVSNGTLSAAFALLLPFGWLLGSMMVLGWSLVRVFRFHRLLNAASSDAPHELHAAAERIARRLDLKNVPEILVTSARLSPMVWWIGGKVHVVMPAALLGHIEAGQWEWVLAHELAHVKRRDYLVRWVEWLACVCCWWNPVMWWARYNLRSNEELCCDALVVSSLHPTPRSYADSLLAAVEYLACPAIRSPAMASEVNSGGQLERRFKMIVSGTMNRKTSRWLQGCVLLCAGIVIPLGMGCARDYDTVSERFGKAVDAGEITYEHAEAALHTLRETAHDDDDWHKDWDEEEYYEEIGKKFKAAVEAGELTEEEALAKWKAVTKKDESWDDAGGEWKKHWDERWNEKDAYYEKIWGKLEAAVAAGKMSQKDAEAKMLSVKNELAAKDKTKGLGKTEAAL